MNSLIVSRKLFALLCGKQSFFGCLSVRSSFSSPFACQLASSTLCTSHQSFIHLYVRSFAHSFIRASSIHLLHHNLRNTTMTMVVLVSRIYNVPLLLLNHSPDPRAWLPPVPLLDRKRKRNDAGSKHSSTFIP